MRPTNGTKAAQRSSTTAPTRETPAKAEPTRARVRSHTKLTKTDDALEPAAGKRHAKPALHQKSRFERPPSYPSRVPVSDAQVPWRVKVPGYTPQEFTDPTVIANDRRVNPKGWADLEAKSIRGSYPPIVDSEGRRLNPFGRTGLGGIGMLGRFGVNLTADNVITRNNPRTGALEVFLIQRTDSDEWGFPAGFVDMTKGEKAEHAFGRELFEETDVELDMSHGLEVYKGYVDDRRNTDHAWIETTVRVLHLSPSEAATLHPHAKDDAKKWKWAPITPDMKLYASHTAFANAAAKILREARGRVLAAPRPL